MTDVSGTDQEKLYLCILKLLKKGSNNEFEKLQELCKEISDDLPDLKIYNDNTSSSTSDDDDEAKKQLNTLVEKGRQDLAYYTPVKTEGDGSCLFRALSLLCFGHQNRHRELRVRCVIDMATYSEDYYDSGILQKKRNESNAISNRSRESMKKSNAVKNEKSENGSAHDVSEFEKSEDSTENGSTEETDENNQPSGNDPLVVDFKKSVCETCDPTAYAGFWEIQALGVILNRKIKIVCSSRDERELEKLEKAYGVDVESDEPLLTIMFLLDDKHFVPLIRKEVKEEEDSGRGDSLNDSKDENTTPFETSKSKKAKDKASKDTNMKNEPNENIDFKPPHTSTPKKTPKERNEQNEDSDDRVDITSADVIDKLNNLLGVKDIEKRLNKEKVSIEALRSLTDPCEMMKLGILRNAPIKLVTKLIEVQFQIKWKTKDGKPKQFNYYDFSNVCNEYFKYNPRRAHVFTEIYRTALEKNEDQRKEAVCPDELKEAFCPDVYVRDKVSWGRICFSRETCEKVTIKKFKNDFSWMHESLLEFVSAKAEKLDITLTSDPKENYTIVAKAIANPTLYWAVLNDYDFWSSSDHLKLHKICGTQVYVGKANGGIRSRWIQDSGSHSEQMMKCMKCVICKQCMKCSHCKKKCSFDAARLRGIQLVDARLLLAKIRNEKRAVILMQISEKSEDLKNVEKQHIKGEGIVSGEQNLNMVSDTWTPKKMQYGMNYKD